MSGSVAGGLRVRLCSSGVEIDSSRPVGLSRHFRGLSPQGVVERVPLLFALCGKAQQLAGALALRSAGAGVPLPEAAEVQVEAAQEYLWRLVIDLPRLLGDKPDLAPFAALRRGLQGEPVRAGEQLAGFLTGLLGEAPDHWRRRAPDALELWLQESDAPAARLLIQAAGLAPQPVQGGRLPGRMDDLVLAFLDAAMDDADFCAAPRWRGECAESSVLCYHAAHPWIQTGLRLERSAVLLRLMARLLELADLCRALGEGQPAVAGSFSPKPGTGLGWVRTARGVLVHRVRLAADEVGDYAILAPTEWNFHPEGELAQMFGQWPQIAHDKRADWAALQVLALDPCVACELEFDHA